MAVNSCGKSQSVKLLTEPQRPLMNPEAIKGPELACVGRTDAVYSIPAISGAETYLWTLPAGWEILKGEGTNSITVKITGRGDVKVKAENACGTTSEAKLTVEVVTSPPLAPAAILGETLTCATRITTYSIEPVAHASSYSWKVPAGWIISSGQGTTQITVQMGTSSGVISVEAENDCDKSDATTLAVTTRPLPVISRIVDRTLACSDIATFELESNNPSALFTWEVPAGWEIMSGQGTSVITVMQGNARGEITVVADNGECKSDPVTMISDPSMREAALNVPNVFTPNNDGENDTWVVGNLTNYPDNEVVVVNRWGNEVYRSKAYQNNWNGDKLAEGTYYYLIRLTLCDGSEKTYKGYVMIVR
ncbi:gliding motility-associated C-terminal domain-containing protein [Pontibacter sp. BAB1700]|uniref:T9SS type B sorting domain-containing protein n=1 Tax=Pontibacter sp. BAB1700 TaxID=1144253 RepID=UPI00026BD5EA|nr:gliding motility-associated C-terminal domain-containing protein [Pontibacter sp. BAB1700]EJF10466.1 b-glycosidase [Pontibacter sp. BAB1700]